MPTIFSSVTCLSPSREIGIVNAPDYAQSQGASQGGLRRCRRRAPRRHLCATGDRCRPYRPMIFTSERSCWHTWLDWKLQLQVVGPDFLCKNHAADSESHGADIIGWSAFVVDERS